MNNTFATRPLPAPLSSQLVGGRGKENDMNRNKAKQVADRIIQVATPEDAKKHLKNMAAILATHNLKAHGFYAFTINNERVFMELTTA